MPNISPIPLALSPIASHFHLRSSLLYVVSTLCDSPGLVQTKHVGPYISQTILYWPYYTKVCAPDIHKTSFHVLEQSLLLKFCVEDQARFSSFCFMALDCHQFTRTVPAAQISGTMAHSIHPYYCCNSVSTDF